MLFQNTRRAVFGTALALLASGSALAAPHGITVLGAPAASPAAQTGTHARPAAKAPTVTVDYDAPGRDSFQASVSLSLSSPIASIAIPAGYRLIVEEVNIAGSAGGTSGPVQPIVLTYPATAAHGQSSYYFSTNPATLLAGVEDQFYADFPVHQYAETFSVGLGYAGYTPSYIDFNVSVSGHLIAITP